jgi:transposase-like protein
MSTRQIPYDVAEYLTTLSTTSPEWRGYVGYLYDHGYTLASIGIASGVSRQYVQAIVRRIRSERPAGAPKVPKVRRKPYKRQSPPLDKQHRNLLLGMWVLSNKHRATHQPDTPWAMARDDFLKEVERLLYKDYTVADIAQDLGVPVDALYRRIQRGRARGVIS